jgi:hypothetical protein
MHVPAPEQALTKLVAALKPRGWLLVEDFDPTFFDRPFPIEENGARAHYQKMLAALLELRAARGNDMSGWGADSTHSSARTAWSMWVWKDVCLFGQVAQMELG